MFVAGTCTLLESAPTVVHLRWEHGTAFAELAVDLASLDYNLRWSQGADTQLHRFRC